MSPAGIVRLVIALIIIAVFVTYCIWQGEFFDSGSLAEGFGISTLVGLLLCITAALYCCFSSSYQNASMKYWDKATAVYLEDAEHTRYQDEVQYNYIMKYKAIPAYRNYRFYYRELFSSTEPEKYSDIFIITTVKGATVVEVKS